MSNTGAALPFALDVLNPEGLRIDGRRPNELRRVLCQLGSVPQADGSASIEQGLTKVIASVYGPREAERRASSEKATINVELDISPFSHVEHKKRIRTERRGMELALSIQKSFEMVVQTHLFPRSQIDIVLRVIENDGGIIHACINAATLALVDAGIPMIDYICACSAGLVGETPMLDLNVFEEKAQADLPKFTLAVLPRSGKTTFMHLEARTHLDKLQLITGLAVDGARQMCDIIDTAARDSANRHVVALNNRK